MPRWSPYGPVPRADIGAALTARTRRRWQTAGRVCGVLFALTVTALAVAELIHLIH